jgi:hypothetical protein
MRNVALVIAIYLACAWMNLRALSNDLPQWTKFDEYSEISLKSEQRRLKDFIFQLRALPGQIAVIVAYGGQESCPREAELRASRTRQLLLKSGVSAESIRVVDAGFQKHWTISLFIGPPDAYPITSQSLNVYDAHIDPGLVKMLRSCKGLKRQRL